MMHRIVVINLLAVVAVAIASCGDAEARQAESQRRAEIQRLRATPGYVVDTIHEMDELIARFRVGLAPPPGMRLKGAAESREELIDRFLAAVQSADTVPLQAMRLDSAEFAWIYFPASPYAQPPYELPPAYVWFHTAAESSKGAQRAARLLSGKAIRYEGYQCADEPEHYGDARLWVSCQLRWRDENGKGWDYRLFGSIIEHDGLFKFVSYANKL